MAETLIFPYNPLIVPVQRPDFSRDLPARSNDFSRDLPACSNDFSRSPVASLLSSYTRCNQPGVWIQY